MDYINRSALTPLYEQIAKITAGIVDSIDWSAIKNKPFGDETVYKNVTWDGKTEGLLSFTVRKEDNTTITYYKISDQVLDYDELYEYLDYEYPEEIKVGENVCYIPDWFIIPQSTIISINEYNNGSDIHVPAIGTYLCNANAGIQYKTQPMKLDNKYLNIASPGVAGIVQPTFFTADTNLPVAVDNEGRLWAQQPTKLPIVQSSTPGSTKRFRILIDDDGNITAKEVE